MDQQQSGSDGGGRAGESAGESADQLWERLAGELRSAREAAGIRPSDWGDTPDVPWTRSHLSNLEHGRGKPTPEIAALYDKRCPHASGSGFFTELQASAARAEERAKGPRRRLRRTLRAPAEPAEPVEGRTRPRSRWWFGAAALAGALGALAAALVLVGEKGGDDPPTGTRTVCAQDLILRGTPGEAAGGEPELVKGETFDVERHAEGSEGAYTYAGGVAHGRVARGEGWVMTRYLC